MDTIILTPLKRHFLHFNLHSDAGDKLKILAMITWIVNTRVGVNTEQSEAAWRSVTTRGDHEGLWGCTVAADRVAAADGDNVGGGDGLSSVPAAKSRRIGLPWSPPSRLAYGGGASRSRRPPPAGDDGELCPTTSKFSPKNKVVDADCWGRRPLCCCCCWCCWWRWCWKPSGEYVLGSLSGWLPDDGGEL